METPSRRPWRLFLLALPVIGVVLLCSGVFTDDDAVNDAANSRDAKRVCEDDFIAKRLKAPSTADYDLEVTGGPDRYTVTGTVDSENSFGAKIRSKVTCVVEPTSSDQWRLIEVTGIN
jgi:hypothetical protein